MLTNDQISVVKGLLDQGYKQHDIAAYFGVNGGRIADIATGKLGPTIRAATGELPNVRPLRHFLPSMSLQQQIEILDNLITTAPSLNSGVRITSPVREMSNDGWMVATPNRTRKCTACGR